MTETPDMAKTQREIADQLERTNKLIERLENHRYLQIADRPFKFLFMSFMQGIAVAVGSTVGFTLVIAVIVYLLRKLEIFTPLGDQLNQIQQALLNLSHK